MQDVVDAAHQQCVLVREMCVKRRATNIRPLKNFVDDDRVVVPFVNREGERRRLAVGLCAPSSLAPRDINIVLFTTQIKHWLVTPPDDHTLKLKVTFCVRGVMTPP